MYNIAKAINSYILLKYKENMFPSLNKLKNNMNAQELVAYKINLFSQTSTSKDNLKIYI